MTGRPRDVTPLPDLRRPDGAVQRVSGGQRRRIAAGRLLLSPARFVIADEPAAQLDAVGAAALMVLPEPDLARLGEAIQRAEASGA